MKKSLGQHWLTDQTSLNLITVAANLSSDDTVLEIGPGSGNLTKLLLSKVNQVIAVEVDSDLAKDLDKFKEPNLTVINQDILEFNLNEIKGEYKIVANIPYYLTSKLIRQISEAKNRPSLVVFLVQKEIANRLSADPGNLSILGLTCQYFWKVEKLQLITADKFDPPPKVDSMIVRLKPKTSPPLNIKDQVKLFQLIRIGFSSKRKTLSNNIASGYKLDKRKANQMLESIKIDPMTRAQSLSQEQWLKLLEIINISS